jgi:hypothetical protein
MMRGAAWPPLLAVALAAGCSGGGGASDAGADGDGGSLNCDWPIDSSTEAGEIQIGTGVSAFEPMPEQLRFIRGTQSGTFLIVHSRMKGLEPGNPDDFLEPKNPKTKFSAVLFDGTVVGRECPSSLGYEPSAEPGYFERRTFQGLEFLPFAVGQKAFDTTVKLRVEVIDSEGRHASDERDVFCEAPEGWSDAGPTDDAGPADAGAADASDGS